MSKRHILGALVALAAWSGAYVPTGTTVASNAATDNVISRLQIGEAAQANVRWKPNPDRGSASSTLSGGRRGIATAACALDSGIPDPALTLLVPAGDETELTTQAQPTLAWFLESKAVADMEFMLFQSNQVEPVYSKEISASAGLVEVTLPADIELEEGVQYRWTVFMNCNSGSSQVHARSFVKRVAAADIPIDTSAMTTAEQATIYAAHGVWYDTLNALIRAYREEAQMKTLLEIRDLLEQAGTNVPLDLSLAIAS